MSAVDFQLIDDEKNDDPIIKRDFIKYTINLEPMLMLKIHKSNSISEKNHNFIQLGNG